jgi:hypothetical protein
MYAGQPAKVKQFYDLFVSLGSLFEVEELYPAAMIKIYLIAATVYVTMGDKESAIDVLEQYVRIVNKAAKSEFILHGNKIFDALEGYYASIDAETDAPRNSKVIWKDIKNALLNNPSFAALEAEERFQQLKKRLEI